MTSRRAWVLGATALVCVASWDNAADAQIWPTAQAKVTRALASDAVEERRQAAQKLHQLPPSLCRELILGALGDSDVQVRQSVGRLALARGYAEVAPRVYAWLSDVDPSLRELGARLVALGNVGNEQVALLARLLSDPVVDVRRTAASALARSEGTAAVQALLNHLTDPNDTVRLAVIDTLGALASKAATLPLVSRLQDPNSAVRRAAVEALGEIEDQTPVEALSLALTDVDTDVRYASVVALASRGSLDAVDALVERMSVDREIRVRVAALRALAELGSRSDCPTALRARIATAIVGCLGHVKQELRDEALATLQRFPALASAELTVCLAEVGANTALMGRTLGCALALAERDRQTSLAARQSQSAAAKSEGYELIRAAWRAGQLTDLEFLTVLTKGNYGEGMPVVVSLLEDPAAQVRLRALETAYTLLEPSQADGRAVEPLGTFLESASTAEELALAIAVLGRSGSPRAVSHLLPFVQEGAPISLRVAAFRALGDIGGAKVPALAVTSALRSDSVNLREAAARAIREGHWSGLGETLVTLLRQATYDEVPGVATALWGVATTMKETALVDALKTEVENALPVHQDALIEAFGRVPWPASQRHWMTWVAKFECPALAKIAEVLGAHPEAKPLLTSLLDSECEAVVLNATWSLRQFQLSEPLFARLVTLAQTGRRRIAGNAIAALANVRPVTSTSPAGSAQLALDGKVVSTLCEGIKGEGVKMRRWGAHELLNALTGLRLRGQRCEGDGGRERELLHHPVRQVRKAAAELIVSVPLDSVGGGRVLDKRGLRFCARHDIDGEVAAACLGSGTRSTPASQHWTTISVVPDSSQEALAQTPYVLGHGRGWVRAGLTDRRGAVLERIHDDDTVALLRP